jgi:nitrate reductase gamma subunit
MVLGLFRLVFLTVWNSVRANLRAGDKTLRWNYIIRYTLHWLFPVKKIFPYRPVYSIVSILFHVGLLLVPIFLLSHVQLWEQSIGIKLPHLSKNLADILTITTIAGGFLLVIFRISTRNARFISRKQEYLWPLLLITPFITGIMGSNAGLNPTAYQIVMLIHFLSADLIFILIPFTKVAHCILIPFSQLVSAQGWRFPAVYGYKVAKTLEREELPI